MTSNQIAYASQLENERHNKAFEEETNRHNVATEKLTNDANQIASEKNIIQSTYNQQMVDLQRAYNAWYSSYTEASTKKKLQLEEEGNQIKQQMNDITEAYNQRMGDIHFMEVDVRRKTAEESKRHNVAMEIQAQALATGDWWFRDLEVREKQRANDITETYNREYLSSVKRGQDLTFDSSVLGLIGKSGVDLGGFGFKIGIHGAPLSAGEALNKILGDHYGSKENPEEGREGSEQTESIQHKGPEGISVQVPGYQEGRSVPGRLR